MNDPDGIKGIDAARLLPGRRSARFRQHDRRERCCRASLPATASVARARLVQRRLPALTSEFFGMMAKRISRCDSGASDCACESTAPTDGKPVSRHIADRASDLQVVLIEDWAGEVAGSTYLEEKFRIPRSTLHRWQRRRAKLWRCARAVANMSSRSPSWSTVGQPWA